MEFSFINNERKRVLALKYLKATMGQLLRQATNYSSSKQLSSIINEKTISNFQH